MLNRMFCALALLVSLVSVSPRALADEIAVPKGSKLVVHLDVQAFLGTDIGSQVVAMSKSLASQQLDKDSDEVLEQVTEALGFDPLEEIQSITLVADSINPQRPLDDAQGHLLIKMKKTSGNIEGLMLAIPEYTSTEFGEYTIHSTENSDMKGFAAIHQAKDGSHSLVVALEEDDVKGVLEQLDGKVDSTVMSGGGAGAFLQLIVPSIPEELIKEGVPEHMVEMVESVSLSIGQKKGKMMVDVRLTTNEEKRAKQIRQMIQGLKAMVSLLEEEIGDDKEIQAAIEMLEEVTVDRDGSVVIVHGEVPEDMVLEFLREDANLPL